MRSRGLLHDTLVIVILVVIVGLGVALRARDPASTPVIGAEDPYTHLVLTKEALQRGFFGDSAWLGQSMYPPGLHALGGALASVSGVSLYDFVLWAPLALGALAIAGTYVLGARLSGPRAGLAAALVVAVMPEHIFRTELWFPTALDLALVPAFLVAFDRVVEASAAEPRGDTNRAGAALFFLLLVPPLAFAHPWVVPLVMAPAVLYAALRALRASPGAWLAARRFAFPATLAAAACAFAVASRWDRTETGFAGFAMHVPPLRWLGDIALPPTLLFALFLAMALAATVPAIGIVAALAHARARTPRAARVCIAILLAVLLLLAIPPMTRNLAQDVDYPSMLGLGAILLALVGFVLAFVRPSRLGDMGVSLALFLFPLTAINVFDSPFWPSRTVAYLSVAVALLAGHAAAFGSEEALALVREGRAMRFAAPATLLASVLLVTGAIAAAPAESYPWYRLYPDDQFAAFEQTAGVMASDPAARVVVYTWQPGLVLKALANPAHVRYAPEFYRDAAARDRVLHEEPGVHVYVLVDSYTMREVQQADTSFLASHGYAKVLESPEGAFALYEVGD